MEELRVAGGEGDRSKRARARDRKRDVPVLEEEHDDSCALLPTLHLPFRSTLSHDVLLLRPRFGHLATLRNLPRPVVPAHRLNPPKPRFSLGCLKLGESFGPVGEEETFFVRVGGLVR